MRRLLRRHVAAGGSFIASTHQPELLDDLATRVIAVQAGAVLYDGIASGWDPDLLDPEPDEDDEDDDDDEDEDGDGDYADEYGDDPEMTMAGAEGGERSR